MNSATVCDLSSTLSGGGAGLYLLSQVKWEQVPHGETVKLAIAVLLIVGGYLMYRKKGQ
jgi:hypothetical protein